MKDAITGHKKENSIYNNKKNKILKLKQQAALLDQKLIKVQMFYQILKHYFLKDLQITSRLCFKKWA